eukprot:UN10240
MKTFLAGVRSGVYLYFIANQCKCDFSLASRAKKYLQKYK